MQPVLHAEQALVRVVHFYGSTPAFVLLGGLCSTDALLGRCDAPRWNQ